MSFTDCKPFTVTADRITAFTSNRRVFNCPLCGHEFKEGDTARWVYANSAESPVRCGNFFVCDKCDAGDEIVLQCAKLGFDKAVELAKRWQIYGPDWQTNNL